MEILFDLQIELTCFKVIIFSKKQGVCSKFRMWSHNYDFEEK